MGRYQGYRAFFAGKRITVMGLGLLGRAVGDATFLAECGAQVLVTDVKTEEQLAESVAQLKKYPNVTFRLGGHDEKDFTDTDMVIKAAGVRFDSPYIAAARTAVVPVYMSTALFAKFAMEMGATVVGITGTRGKSTVTQMIYHVLQHAVPRLPSTILGINRSGQEKHVFLGGNVRGISTLAMLPDVQAGDIAVLELDSWQLQGFGDLGISPNVSVFTNLLTDHQNYYKDMDEYFADKANIFRYQKTGDVLVVGAQVVERVKRMLEVRPPHGGLTSSILMPPLLPPDWHLKIPGEHNRENAALAKAALEALPVGRHGLNIPEARIKTGLESFEGVEGRLQFVREIHGVKIYNDNNATTPDATIAALKALREAGGTSQELRLVLIMGGADKGLDMKALAEEINKSCKYVILLNGTGTSAFLITHNSYPLPPTSGPIDSLEAAVEEALHIAKPDDTILFSPAFASFGMFKSEYDRNDQFMNLVRTLQ